MLIVVRACGELANADLGM
jgi:pentatricopeptide repeat protein